MRTNQARRISGAGLGWGCLFSMGLWAGLAIVVGVAMAALTELP